MKQRVIFLQVFLFLTNTNSNTYRTLNYYWKRKGLVKEWTEKKGKKKSNSINSKEGN